MFMLQTLFISMYTLPYFTNARARRCVLCPDGGFIASLNRAVLLTTWIGLVHWRRGGLSETWNLQTQWLSDHSERGWDGGYFRHEGIILYVFWGLPFGYQIASISNPVSVIVCSSSGTASLCLSLSLESCLWFTWGCKGKTLSKSFQTRSIYYFSTSMSNF